VLTGNAFINDMAQNASPLDVQTGAALLASTNTVIDPVGPPLAKGTYDNESLNVHYVAGDGRVNENVGLTAVQELFHSEHDRLPAQTQATIQQNLDNGDVSFASNWVLPGVDLTAINGVTAAGVPTHIIQPNEWNGEPAHRVRRIRPYGRTDDPRRRRRQCAYRPGDHLGVRQRRLSLRPLDARRKRQPLCPWGRRKAGNRRQRSAFPSYSMRYKRILAYPGRFRKESWHPWNWKMLAEVAGAIP
jgi:hypothetical protein